MAPEFHPFPFPDGVLEMFYPRERGLGPDWLPTSPADFAEVVPDRPRGSNAVIEFAGWLLLDPLRRVQFIRESETSSALRRQQVEWELRDVAFATSVGACRFLGRRRLCGNLHVDASAPVALERTLRLPRAFHAPSRIPGAQTTVPLRLQAGSPEELYSGGPIFREGVGDLRAGDGISGENPAGFRDPGTLSCFVHRHSEPLLLGSGHVFGEQGNDVYAANSSRHPGPLGEVQETCTVLDASIARCRPDIRIDVRLREPAVIPAAPIPATVDLPVQFHGAESRYQQGSVSRTNFEAIGAWQVGLNPFFQVRIAAAPGDSGALIVAGHGTDPPYQSEFVRFMDPQFVASSVCAMLGIVKAGQSATADRSIDTIATPILSILSRFNVEPMCKLALEEAA